MTWCCSNLYWPNNTAVMGKNAAFYPRLSILTKKYFAIPASYIMYVPSEQVFSIADHLVNKKRARLSPSNIGNIISWIKAWNNTDNYTIWVWMTMFCFLWTVQSNLFMFDSVCRLLNFSQNLLSLFTVYGFII